MKKWWPEEIFFLWIWYLLAWVSLPLWCLKPWKQAYYFSFPSSYVRMLHCCYQSFMLFRLQTSSSSTYQLLVWLALFSCICFHCRTQFLTAFISVNLLATFRKHLKNISFPIDILCLPLTHHLRFNFYFVLYKLIYLLTYLLTYLTSFCLCRWHRHRVTWNHWSLVRLAVLQRPSAQSCRWRCWIRQRP